jgi:hypothetical protein
MAIEKYENVQSYFEEALDYYQAEHEIHELMNA